MGKFHTEMLLTIFFWSCNFCNRGVYITKFFKWVRESSRLSDKSNERSWKNIQVFTTLYTSQNMKKNHLCFLPTPGICSPMSRTMMYISLAFLGFNSIPLSRNVLSWNKLDISRWHSSVLYLLENTSWKESTGLHITTLTVSIYIPSKLESCHLWLDGRMVLQLLRAVKTFKAMQNLFSDCLTQLEEDENQIWPTSWIHDPLIQGDIAQSCTDYLLYCLLVFRFSWYTA